MLQFDTDIPNFSKKKKGAYDQAIVYERTDNLANTIWGWVDSDWAADLDSRRSHTGYMMMMSFICSYVSTGR